MRVTVLGCGHSGGTPLIGSGWGLCDPENPKNRRLRPSILVEEGESRVLVDTSPDLRQQLLDANVDRINAVLYTHAHADHLHGIDDLRAINRIMKADIPAYGDAATWRTIRERFPYILTPLSNGSDFYYKPQLTPHTIAPGDTFNIGPITIHAFDQDHEVMRTLGYRFGKFAYSTDVVRMPEESLAVLEGVAVWMVGTLMAKPHPTHAHVDQALEWSEKLSINHTILTHLSHRADFNALQAMTEDNVEPAYDGMIIDIV
ncbi:MAG: MBL fold metallo-hydrolase [Pseudomonadota bacterium]|nr:MBL fold metallo-hydrolase [Pseudomonadota bacterium]